MPRLPSKPSARRSKKRYRHVQVEASVQAQKGECDVCERIGLLLQAPMYGHEIELGDSDALRQSPCKIHPQLVARAFELDLSSMQLSDISVLSFKGLAHLQLRAFDEAAEPANFKFSGELQLLSHLQKPPQHHGKLVNPRWTAHSLPERWLARCLTEHADKCEPHTSAKQLERVRPSWLIDVWRQCLTKPMPNGQYVALSYVWGGTPQFMSLKSNINRLQEDLSLSDSKDGTQLPRTIRETIMLVERLGLRYLWVDSLCIVQDDAMTKNTDISNMAAIYSNATLTIVASDGKNADSGLSGLPGISKPRSVRQTVHRFHGGIHVVESNGNGLHPSFERTVWHTRGWTYQEHMFSRRRLFFENGWIRWECNNAVWKETDACHGPIFLEPVSGDPRTGLFQFVPSTEVLMQVISVYNRRDLTFPEDALHGISGCLTALSHSLPDGFISGLPTGFFYAALLWNPLQGLARRIARNSESANCLPSWSWAGWHGYIDTWFWGVGFVKQSPTRMALRQFDRIQPLVTWSWHTTANGQRTPIHNSWWEFEQRYHNTGDRIPCPENWTRHKMSLDDDPESWRFMTHPDLSAKPSCFYKHESEPQSEFWYPVPLLTDVASLKAQVQAPYISCTTKRVFLRAGDVFAPKYWRQISALAIEDDKGEWVGAIRLQEGSAQGDGTVQVTRPPRGQIVELVEIALGCVPSDVEELYGHHAQVLEEWYHERRPRTHPLYEYYFVLWVEWSGGIAYRKAMGRMEKTLWEAQKRDEIQLTLG